MPIRRELRPLYPPHWRELSSHVRFERAVEAKEHGDIHGRIDRSLHNTVIKNKRRSGYDGNRPAGRIRMIAIETQRQFRDVANLPFCYWCGLNIQTGDAANGDHVPPKNAFDIVDRTPTLILTAHVACNNGHKIADELIGQLVALQRDYVTPDPKNRRLKMEVYPGQSFGSVTNVNVVQEAARLLFRARHLRMEGFGRRGATARAWVRGRILPSGRARPYGGIGLYRIGSGCRQPRPLGSVRPIVAHVWGVARPLRRCGMRDKPDYHVLICQPRPGASSSQKWGVGQRGDG